MNSFNPYALGAVVGVLFRRVAGIAPTAPGFRRFAVRPVLDPRMESAGATYDSRLGRIETHWRRLGKTGLSLDLLVPPGATASVYLPGVLEAGAGSPTRFAPIVDRDGRSAIEVPSGRYAFRSGMRGGRPTSVNSISSPTETPAPPCRPASSRRTPRSPGSA